VTLQTSKSYKSFEVGAKGELGTMACIKSNVWIAAASSIVVCQPTVRAHTHSCVTCARVNSHLAYGFA
jgi:hypothetical protein